MHECAYHVQAKDGFQFLCVNGRFSKKHSHIIICMAHAVMQNQLVVHIYFLMHAPPLIKPRSDLDCYMGE